MDHEPTPQELSAWLMELRQLELGWAPEVKDKRHKLLHAATMLDELAAARVELLRLRVLEQAVRDAMAGAIKISV